VLSKPFSHLQSNFLNIALEEHGAVEVDALGDGFDENRLHDPPLLVRLFPMRIRVLDGQTCDARFRAIDPIKNSMEVDVRVAAQEPDVRHSRFLRNLGSKENEPLGLGCQRANFGNILVIGSTDLGAMSCHWPPDFESEHVQIWPTSGKLHAKFSLGAADIDVERKRRILENFTYPTSPKLDRLLVRTS